jgi:hypothetical protein
MWVRQASFGLIGQDKIEYVNGDIPVPVPQETGAPPKRRRRPSKSGKGMTIEWQGGSWQQWSPVYLRS